jgi:hypothetical protein
MASIAKKRSDSVTVVPPPKLTVPAPMTPEDSRPDTDVPPSLPTLIPAFDVGQVARNAQVISSEDDVYVAVPGVAWSVEALDLTERNVLEHLDGIAPLWLVESSLGITRDELHSVLCVLQARGLVVLCDGPSESGTFLCIRDEDLPEEARRGK